ncbi:DNA-directed RNA polymerase III subunit C1 (rpo31) [Recurvomyces mirabilis]|uniref:DNA-directed RNA polymerase subunit n=1 Tax=Recurvomyces mirabilis TaxID=574656 RepID=A0AAE1C5L6_9PEZI|nr:DNA-directed RNA polymerase III subunit C1 (rpo31) [Recurvomyces mirabilis]KAK5161332.1 DNA-directed RNA polymerase III subunit C1 (rpo31) [Recurvomyces mirabilis]
MTTTLVDDFPDITPKEQVLSLTPKRISALQFGIASPADIVAQSVVTVNDRNLYDNNVAREAGKPRTITRYGPLDEKLGTSSKSGTCETCGMGLKECNGHFGQIKLALPAFHYGYLKKIIECLHCVCKNCSRILLAEKDRRAALKQLRKPGLDSLRKSALIRKISTDCRKNKVCPSCGGLNGPVKKVPANPTKIFHNKFAVYTSSNAKSKKKPPEMQEFEESFKEARKSQDVERNMRRVADDLNPLKVLNIFKKVPDVDVELMGMEPCNGGRPEYMLWTHVPAPPVAIRPSVAQEATSTEDDITNKLADIVQMSNLLKTALTKGASITKVMEIWEFLQVQVAMYIDGNLPGLGKESNWGKMMRGFCQRLKGKQGRFRGNLSGKRVDFSGRTVISPDPNLSINEVAVPVRVALTMTYPERVTRHNMEKLKACILNGTLKHPGANHVIKAHDGRKIMLKVIEMKGDLTKITDKLVYGDIVERHLEDGDIVLFNRQPSLHKLSILSHRAKIRPWRTFRLNECVCNPYNADFDGDEMNLHVPQTEEARTEATELMGVQHNLATPKNGTPIIAAIQDFITGAYLISQKDLFFNRRQFCQVISFMFDGMEVRDPLTNEQHDIEIPPPAIYKPQQLWTGKQVWSVLMKPHSDYPVLVNLDAKCKQFAAPPPGTAPDMLPNDSYVVVRNSVVMCGTMDKAVIGDGKKDSIFYVIMRDFGPEYAVAAMNRLAKLSARWLTEQGFSIGISDVYPSGKLREEKEKLVTAAYDKCVKLIKLFNEGNLQRDPGCDEEQTMENQISGILSKVRQQCGDVCFSELSRYNAPLTMAKCGSKGSNINVSQMVAAVGQQIIGGKRVVDGFQDRTLPHFSKASRDPPAKGFVVNSFFSGLNPTEFIFHAMSGREGLVDTAVKTAETGYMSRRLMKSLEDLSARYDLTVRNGSEGVVQMRFGDDGLDPVDMEGSAKPVNFERTWMFAITTTWRNEEKGLSGEEVEGIVEETLGVERKKIKRFADDGRELAYGDQTDEGVDQLESVRNFLETVQVFIRGKMDGILESQRRHAATTLDGKPGIFKLSPTALHSFLKLCLLKFEKSKVEAGHAVGAVGAQSIGEPGTQMTLKTFHFAGVAGMSITQGVPRIKEIINASKVISTPVITCALDSKYEEIAGKFAKAVIQKTYLEDVVNYVEDVWGVEGGYLNVKVDWQTVKALGLKMDVWGIREAIERHKGFKALSVSTRVVGTQHIRVYCEPNGKGLDGRAKGRGGGSAGAKGKMMRMEGDEEGMGDELFMTLQQLKRKLPKVVIKGYPDAHRAILKKDDKPDASGREPIAVFVEGYGLKLCMTTEGVDGYHTTSNSVMEVRAVLGIEAARSTIIAEISAVMGGMDIDPRHMQLLADIMTYKGDVLGITRFGMAKMRDSVLQLASFEKTPDHLFEAAIMRKKDLVEGVSECIILGQGMKLGTGGLSVVRPLGLDGGKGVSVGGGSGSRLRRFKGALGGVSAGRRKWLEESRGRVVAV